MKNQNRLPLKVVLSFSFFDFGCSGVYLLKREDLFELQNCEKPRHIVYHPNNVHGPSWVLVDPNHDIHYCLAVTAEQFYFPVDDWIAIGIPEKYLPRFQCEYDQTEPSLLQHLESLSNYGTLKCSGDYFYLELQKDWKKLYSEPDWVRTCTSSTSFNSNEAKRKAEEWAKLLSVDNPSFDYFTPITLLGPHVTIKNPVAPSLLGHKVRFRVKKMSSCVSTRSIPINFPHDEKTEDGLRDYASFWIFCVVELVDTDLETPYQPHISLCCYGLKNVPIERVKRLVKLQQERESRSSLDIDVDSAKFNDHDMLGMISPRTVTSSDEEFMYTRRKDKSRKEEEEEPKIEYEEGFFEAVEGDEENFLQVLEDEGSFLQPPDDEDNFLEAPDDSEDDFLQAPDEDSQSPNLDELEDNFLQAPDEDSQSPNLDELEDNFLQAPDEDGENEDFNLQPPEDEDTEDEDFFNDAEAAIDFLNRDEEITTSEEEPPDIDFLTAPDEEDFETTEKNTPKEPISNIGNWKMVGSIETDMVDGRGVKHYRVRWLPDSDGVSRTSWEKESVLEEFAPRTLENYIKEEKERKGIIDFEDHVRSQEEIESGSMGVLDFNQLDILDQFADHEDDTEERPPEVFDLDEFEDLENVPQPAPQMIDGETIHSLKLKLRQIERIKKQMLRGKKISSEQMKLMQQKQGIEQKLEQAKIDNHYNKIKVPKKPEQSIDAHTEKNISSFVTKNSEDPSSKPPKRRKKRRKPAMPVISEE